MISQNDETIKAILDTAERFAERELLDGAHDRDAYPYSDFNHDAVRGAAEAGLLYLSAPEDMCGCGLPAGVWALVLERTAAADAGFAAVLLAHAAACHAVLQWAADPVKKEWIGTDPPRLLGYPLYLQVDDPQGLPAARETDQGFVLTGKAAMVANAPVADAAVIAAELGREIGLFLVPLADDRPAPVETLGLRSCPLGHLDLADVAVPAKALLASGVKKIAELHEAFYPAAAAILLASHKASLDYALEYGSERYQGGRMIREHTQLRSMYGMMAAEILTLRAAWLGLLSGDGDGESALALKIMAGDLAVRGTTDGVQLLGGYGYTMEYPQERRMRDARQAAEILGSPARQKLTLVDGMIGGSGA